MNARCIELVMLSAQAFVLALAALVAMRLLTGRIVTRGLLGANPLRIQALIATCISAASYAAAEAHTTDFTRLPPASPELLALVGGSNALMLALHAAQRFTRTNSNPERSEP